jgi:hypothetical protein
MSLPEQNGSLLDKLRGLWSQSDAPEEEKDEPLPPQYIPEVIIDYGQRNRPSEAKLDDPTQTSRQADGLDLVYLRQQMSNHLDVDGLRSISDQLGLAWDELSGGKGRRVLALISWCEQNGRLPDLLQACEAQNTAVAWQPD